MTLFRRKSTNNIKRTVSKFFTIQYLRHILLVIFITLIIGFLLSLPIARKTTVNDTTIKYTQPPVEEFDTEGYSGASPVPEETPAESEPPAPEETPAEQETPVPEEPPVEPEPPAIE